MAADLSDFLGQLRSKVTISEIVALQVRLKRRGHEFLGLCPFHKEKSPSFTVNDAKGFYHCFGCGENGDAFAFVQKTQNLPFMEAVAYIAQRLGITMPTNFSSQSETVHPSLYAVLAAAAAWFESQLHNVSREYLDKRGVSPETRRLFHLGYAPNQGLKRHLLQQGFDESVQMQAGLLVASEKGEPYERFRNRLIFPIMNRQGQVVAFGGRILLNGEPKYLNSPETTLFHKGKMLYGLNMIGAQQRLLVVEGYMDVITLHQAGVHGVVSPLGTALGEEQISLLWRYGPEPLLCFDGDTAGIMAGYKVARKVLPLLKPGHTLRFCFLPHGEDPDSLVRQQGGGDVFRGLMENAHSLVDVLWRELVATYTTDTPDARATLHARVTECWRAISDNSIQHYYRQALEERMRELFFKPRGTATKKGFPTRSPAVFTKPLPKKKLAEKILLVTLLNHPKLVVELCEELMSIQFFDARYERIRQSLLALSLTDDYLQEGYILERMSQQEGADAIHELLNERTYSYAPFARASAPPQQAQAGWLHVWEEFAAGDQLVSQVSEVVASDDFDKQAWDRLKHLKMSREGERL
ncbi:MAG: DNA primase [Alphaproteobacteria bacterium]